MKWAEGILPEERKGVTIALDGKTVRSTGKMEGYDSPLHIISAQLPELGITFASKSVEGKSNEIPAVQQLIGELDIQGCMVAADALNISFPICSTIEAQQLKSFSSVSHEVVRACFPLDFFLACPLF